MFISKRCQQLQPSATLAVSQKARELKAEGKDIITLSMGEPDFPTPDFIKQAGIEAIENNHTRYTPADGTPAIKEAIMHKFERDNQIQYQPKQIIVSSGAKQSLYNAAQALLNPGDEVIIPAPYWVSYPAMVELAGGKSVVIPTDIHQGFKITAKQLQDAITDRSKIFVLNSPSNPSGMVYSADELSALAEVLMQHPQIAVLCDDIYEHLCWGSKQFVSILNVCPDLYERTMVVNGVSKAYAMTGWRIGYLAGPEPWVKAMNKIQSQSTSNPCSISQYAATAALNGGTDCIKPMVQAFAQRAAKVDQALNDMPGISCLPVHATLYAFANVSDAMQQLGLSSDIDFANYLLDHAEIAVVPGTAFGLNGYIRISIAAADEQLDAAMQRMNNTLKKSVGQL